MKKITFALLAMSSSLFFAQEEQLVEAKTDSLATKNWSIEGQHSLMLNQAAFSNWVGGGTNNVGWIAGINYNLTYQKDKDLWENIIVLGYGQNDTKGTGTRKTQDVLNLSTNYGRKVSKSWYASAGAGLITQFAPGYTYGTPPADDVKTSNFMAPGYLSVGAGFTYKPAADFTLTLRPANARWTFVLDKELQKEGLYGLKNDGDSSLFQLGFLATAQYKLKLMENITLANTVSVFSNYLDHPDRLVLSYGGVLNMKINKYISSVITLDLLYDHNQIKKTQLKQTLGVGFAYNLSNGVKRDANTDNRSWSH